MKKKKVWIYLLSFIIPISIFLICATLNKFLPFGDELLNAYDSFTQYPGMILEYARLLKNGNIFYSWGGGLGFNFLGSITYYGMSPLNLFALIANPENYHMYIAIMTLIRFGLLGLSMAFYLDNREIKPKFVVLFSTIYALMGYTCTYYYNYIWIDSIIMLPLVIHGLDKLLKGESPLWYIVTLTITIMINYYIGYMICIFSLIWFLYNLINIKDKKNITKTFFISSLLSGLMSAVVLLPSVFALLTGKAELYETINYLGLQIDFKTFFYNMTSGAYHTGDQIKGPALVYSSILVLILTIFYFFNNKFSKKEKIATLIVLLFFYLSFSVKCINYVWHLFQRPIWWQGRFAFLFSFFLIVLASKTLMDIDKTNFPTKKRLIIASILLALIGVGAYFKWQDYTEVTTYTYIFLGFSILIIIEFMFLLDKKYFLSMIMIFTILEVSLNTFNSLKNNYRYKSYTNYLYLKEEVPDIIKRLDNENEYFYRMEFMRDYTSNDGLYFGFNGINYFNSARNIDVVNLMSSLGVTVYDKCHIELLEFDPFLMSLFNIKYLYGNDHNYYKETEKRVFENPYPLAIGFMANEKIKDLKLDESKKVLNRDLVFKALTNKDSAYETISYDSFIKDEDEALTTLTYKFKATSDSMIIHSVSNDTSITVNDTNMSTEKYVRVSYDDEVKVVYTFLDEIKEEDVFLMVLDLEKYQSTMEKLESHTLKAKTNTNGHILEGNIDVNEDYKYLFTSIEYEKGMKIYVDGKVVEPDIVLGALIGLELEPGTHEIVIDYIPKGLIGGSVVSLLALGGTVFYLQKRKSTL